MARPQEEVICGRDKKSDQRGREAGQGTRRGSHTQTGEEPRGSAAILGSPGRPRVWFRRPAWPPGPKQSRDAGAAYLVVS